MNWKLPSIVCVLAVAAAACPNQNQARDSKSLLQMEDFWVQALNNRNSDSLDCLLAPDFGDSNWKGMRLTRAEVLDAASKRTPPPPGARHQFEDMNARIYGDTGIVSGLSYWIYSDGSKHNSARFTDIFIYRNGHWLAVAGQETRAQEKKK